MSRALVQAGRGGSTPAPLDAREAFDFSDLRVFTTIPPHHDVVTMRGLVVVYETDSLHRDGIEMGKLYVRENQRPRAGQGWERWLEREWAERRENHSPSSLLRTEREVVQAITWPRTGGPALRLASGFVDGPYHEWAFGRTLIGKVVGLYRPGAPA